MAATLQTLAFWSPISVRGGVFRFSPFPANLSRFRLHTPVPSSLSSLSRGSLNGIGLPVATSGFDQDHLYTPRTGNGLSRAYGSNHFNSIGFSSLGLFLFTKQVVNFARSNFLPLALIAGIFLGFTHPRLGQLAVKYPLSKFSTVGIFFISGLLLRTQEISGAIEAWVAGILGLTSILLVTPFFAWVILKVSLSPREFVTGLAIFCCMPTTLSSGVALTQLVGGNSALALAMTVISNLFGIMTVPFSLAKFVGGEADVSLPTMQLFKSLVMTLLVPLAMGKVLRNSLKSVAAYVDQNRQYLAMISSVLLSIVPATQVSRSKSHLLAVRPQSLAAAVIMGVLLHLIILALNIITVRAFSLFCGGEESVLAKRENARAVVIVASQKTLPVMVAVVEQLGGALGEPGLLVLPCVAAHINQIIVDSFLVNWWMKKDRMARTTKGE